MQQHPSAQKMMTQPIGDQAATRTTSTTTKCHYLGEQSAARPVDGDIGVHVAIREHPGGEHAPLIDEKVGRRHLKHMPCRLGDHEVIVHHGVLQGGQDTRARQYDSRYPSGRGEPGEGMAVSIVIMSGK